MPKRDRTIFAAEPPSWDVRGIIQKLGGVGPTTEKLMAKGFFPPPPDTVQGWVTRSSVPGAWSPALFTLAMEANLIESPMDALMNSKLKKPRRAAS